MHKFIGTFARFFFSVSLFFNIEMKVCGIIEMKKGFQRHIHFMVA